MAQAQALDLALGEVREFMAKQTRKSDLALFLRIAGEDRPRSIDEVGFLTLVPAFITSELKTAFQMGFIIFLPFLVIDLVISCILISMGMFTLPPVMMMRPRRAGCMTLAASLHSAHTAVRLVSMSSAHSASSVACVSNPPIAPAARSRRRIRRVLALHRSSR